MCAGSSCLTCKWNTWFLWNIIPKYHHAVPVFKGWLQRRWRLPVHKESHGKDRRVMGTSYSWRDCDWTQEENFSLDDQALEYSPQGSGGFLNTEYF